MNGATAAAATPGTLATSSLRTWGLGYSCTGASLRVATPPPPAVANPMHLASLFDDEEGGLLTPRRTADSLMSPLTMSAMESQKNMTPCPRLPPGLENPASAGVLGTSSSVAASGFAAPMAFWDWTAAPVAPPPGVPMAGAPVPPPPAPHGVPRGDLAEDLHTSLSKALTQTRRKADPSDESSVGRPRPPLPEELPLPAVTGNSTAESPPSLGSRGHPENCAGACRYVKRMGGCRDGENCTQCHLCFWHRRSAVARQLIRMGMTAEDEPALQDMATEGETTEFDTFAKAKPESVGTNGHPFTCSEPCKYVRRRTGCRDGAACTKCHSCQWRRKPAGEQETIPEEETDPSADQQALLNPGAIVKLLGAIPAPPGLTRDGGNSPVPEVRLADCPSLGSLGHPWNCNRACTELASFGSCKEGWQCSACHLCGQKKGVDEELTPTPTTSLGSTGHPVCCSSPCKYVRRKGGCRDGAQCPHCHLCRWSRKHRRGDEEEPEPEVEV